MKHEYLKGGKADGMPDKDFDQKELKKGTKHERAEHTKNKTIAKEIAKDHIVEDPKYYDHLEKVEKMAFVDGFNKISNTACDRAKIRAIGNLGRQKKSLHKKANVLTSKARKHIKEENFALPGRRYPIHDQAHARNALARVAQNGTPAEQAAVKKAVYAKFPALHERHEEREMHKAATANRHIARFLAKQTNHMDLSPLALGLSKRLPGKTLKGRTHLKALPSAASAKKDMKKAKTLSKAAAVSDLAKALKAVRPGNGPKIGQKHFGKGA